MPLLYIVGLIDEFIFITWLLVGGSVYRTIYTSWRSLQAAIAQQEIPWIALLVELIPTAGILAYPCQIIWSAKGKKQKSLDLSCMISSLELGQKFLLGVEKIQIQSIFRPYDSRLPT